MIRGLVLVLVTALAAVCALPRSADAQEPATTSMPRLSRSGYERVRSLGGPDSVSNSLRRHDTVKGTFYRGHAIQDALAPYYRFKRRLKDRFGLAFGFDFNMLYQGATAGLTESEASGGAFRIYAHWTALGRGSPTTTEIVARVEHRHRYWTPLSPSELGPALGSLFKTANSFDSWGWGLTNLQLQQWFANGRYGVAVGQVDLRDWVDAFELANWRTMFLSAAGRRGQVIFRAFRPMGARDDARGSKPGRPRAPIGGFGAVPLAQPGSSGSAPKTVGTGLTPISMRPHSPRDPRSPTGRHASRRRLALRGVSAA